MTNLEPIEKVIQHSPDRQSRIIKRTFTYTNYKNWVVEFRKCGQWVRSKNGPWDYLSNARRELHDPSMAWIRVNV